MPDDLDYGNARLRAMKSRLLSRRTLQELTEAGSVQGLLTGLTNTAYREAVQAALVRLSSLECLAEALRNDLLATVGKARAFYSGPAGDLAALVFRRYDLHNVKTVLRGLTAHVPASEILANTLPIGELRPADLAELTRMENWHAAIDLLATWRLALAQPLLESRSARRGRDASADLFEMEVALDRWHTRTAMQAVAETDTVLRETLALEADAANIMTALRLVGAPDVTAILHERFGSADATPLLIGPGRVPFALLSQAARQESMLGALDVLAGTPYGDTLDGARDAYAASARLSVFERALARRQLAHSAGLIARDPLGIGVLIGYVALKTNEVSNLRMIAQSLLLGDKPDSIQKELMVIDS